MQCPNCQVAFHNNQRDWQSVTILTEERWHPDWTCWIASCPTCNSLVIKRSLRHFDEFGEESWSDERVIFPSNQRHAPAIAPAVPDPLKVDYVEAFLVLPSSAKASAALSRRVLQSILREQGYQSKNLFDQVKEVLAETEPDRILPLELRNTIDAVRKFGNFSAHPITDTTSLQVIDVDPAEADWCLQIIQALFEHYYIRPAANEKRLAKLEQKLQKARKPPARS